MRFANSLQSVDPAGVFLSVSRSAKYWRKGVENLLNLHHFAKTALSDNFQQLKVFNLE